MAAPVAVPVRRVDAAAAPTLAAVQARCRTAAYEETWSADAIATILLLPGAIALVASGDQGAVVGMVMVRVAATEAEILSLGVAPQARRRGVASLLLGAATAAAAAVGADRAVLEVAVDNTAAVALYRRCGWAEFGRRRGYYRRAGGQRIDALVMAKKVAGAEQK